MFAPTGLRPIQIAILGYLILPFSLEFLGKINGSKARGQKLRVKNNHKAKKSHEQHQLMFWTIQGATQ